MSTQKYLILHCFLIKKANDETYYYGKVKEICQAQAGYKGSSVYLIISAHFLIIIITKQNLLTVQNRGPSHQAKVGAKP